MFAKMYQIHVAPVNPTKSETTEKRKKVKKREVMLVNISLIL